jgi:hypothetical protein
MKAAPWFVDFFAPAIEENHHARPGEAGERPEQPPAATEHGKYFSGGGSSWVEVQNAELITNIPLYLTEAGTAEGPSGQENGLMADEKESPNRVSFSNRSFLLLYFDA